MNPFRQLNHRRRQLEAVRNIGIKVQHLGLVYEADRCLEKVEWFATECRRSSEDWLAGHIGPNGWGAQWDDLVESAKFHRMYERRMRG